MCDVARVLVIGHRSGILEALERRGVPFVVWHDAPVKARRADGRTVVARFPQSPEGVRKALPALDLGAFDLGGPVTHVLAGTERSVVTASLTRKALGARRSAHTTAVRCHDKLFMKETLAKLGIPMTPFSRADRGAPELIAELDTPVVIKDRRSSGGHGVEVLHTAAEIEAARRRQRIAERYVAGDELSIESFISDGEVRFVSHTEYLEKGRVNVVPAKLDRRFTEEIDALNARVIAGLGIRWGLTHLEIYSTNDGPLFGEIALRPPGGYIMELLSLAWGFDAWDAFVAVELGEPFTWPHRPVARAAAWVMHPGPGTLTRIHGEQAARAIEGVTRLRIRAQPGDSIAARDRLGRDIGYALISRPSRTELIASLDEIRSTLCFEMDPAREAPDRHA